MIDGKDGSKVCYITDSVAGRINFNDKFMVAAIEEKGGINELEQALSNQEIDISDRVVFLIQVGHFDTRVSCQTKSCYYASCRSS